MSQLPIDLEGERSGLMPSREWKQRVKREPWYLGESVIASFWIVVSLFTGQPGLYVLPD